MLTLAKCLEFNHTTGQWSIKYRVPLIKLATIFIYFFKNKILMSPFFLLQKNPTLISSRIGRNPKRNASLAPPSPIIKSSSWRNVFSIKNISPQPIVMKLPPPWACPMPRSLHGFKIVGPSKNVTLRNSRKTLKRSKCFRGKNHSWKMSMISVYWKRSLYIPMPLLWKVWRRQLLPAWCPACRPIHHMPHQRQCRP